MRYLRVQEVVNLHSAVIARSGGLDGLRNPEALKSALAQPEQMFGGEELYPSIEEKAAILGFLLIMNHAFLDGNKRIAHAAIETFLMLNGRELEASEQESLEFFVNLAAGERTKDDLLDWIREHIVRS